MGRHFKELHDAGASNEELRGLLQQMDGVDECRNEILSGLNPLFMSYSISRIPPIRISSKQIEFSKVLEHIHRLVDSRHDMYGLYYLPDWEEIRDVTK